MLDWWFPRPTLARRRALLIPALVVLGVLDLLFVVYKGPLGLF